MRHRASLFDMFQLNVTTELQNHFQMPPLVVDRGEAFQGIIVVAIYAFQSLPCTQPQHGVETTHNPCVRFPGFKLCRQGTCLLDRRRSSQQEILADLSRWLSVWLAASRALFSQGLHERNLSVVPKQHQGLRSGPLSVCVRAQLQVCMAAHVGRSPEAGTMLAVCRQVTKRSFPLMFSDTP